MYSPLAEAVLYEYYVKKKNINLSTDYFIKTNMTNFKKTFAPSENLK